MILEYEMIHGALPRMVTLPRRQVPAPRGAVRSEAPPQPPLASGPVTKGEWDVSALEYEQMLRRCESSGKPCVPPYHGRIEDDTPIDPRTLADCVSQEAALWVGGTSPHEWAVELAERASVVYQHNARFRGRVRRAGGAGQHYLVAFMRHWLCALLQSRRPGLAARLPSSYASGHELPQREQPTLPRRYGSVEKHRARKCDQPPDAHV